ncbi:Holliday junction resolvase RuvX [Candidatus Pelagibacter sp.]|nr:Holliday junction resolvase RuvX [Candidatus Pelagibacter sp.]
MIYNMVTIEEFKKKHTNKVRLIGLDIGSKIIGVSICDEKQSIATPFKTINKTNFNDLINKLKKIIEENNIKGIIIGNPVNMDGSLGNSAQSIKDTSNNIAKSIDLPLCLWDERLSTVGAFNLSSQLDVNISKIKKNIDKNAAAFILQGALDYLNN